jgi:hypothetical protein
MNLSDLAKMSYKEIAARTPKTIGCVACKGQKSPYSDYGALCERHYYEELGKIVEKYPIGVPHIR